MGIAMGRVGMSRQDFEHCTPSEFSGIVKEYRDREEALYRDGWERTRVQVVSVANLFSKRGISAKKAFPLPWDTGKDSKVSGGAECVRGTSSPERMREIATRIGLCPRDA